jgi:hypothetical protein
MPTLVLERFNELRVYTIIARSPPAGMWSASRILREEEGMVRGQAARVGQCEVLLAAAEGSKDLRDTVACHH